MKKTFIYFVQQLSLFKVTVCLKDKIEKLLIMQQYDRDMHDYVHTNISVKVNIW